MEEVADEVPDLAAELPAEPFAKGFALEFGRGVDTTPPVEACGGVEDDFFVSEPVLAAVLAGAAIVCEPAGFAPLLIASAAPAGAAALWSFLPASCGLAGTPGRRS